MKEKIIKILENKKRPSQSLIEINDALRLTTAEELEEVQKNLKHLEEEGIVYYSEKKKNYTLIKNTHYLQGKLILNPKGYGFVVIENHSKDVYINEVNLAGATNDDIVLIEIIDMYRNEGRVVKILKKDDKEIVGEVYYKEGKCYVRCNNRKYGDIPVIKDETHNIVDGSVVMIKRTNHNAIITKLIGHKNDVGIDILSYVYQYNFHPNFPEDVIEELSTIPNEVSPSDLKGRKDLRDLTIFTIDGDDTKDIDDAISIKKNPTGTYNLGVHIADVSHYVKENSPLDKEAYFRSTSVYLVDRVVPMLPHKLSNGICSLNPGVDRLAMTCMMEIDPNGKVINKEIYPSVIRSRLQMTYNKVNDILEKNIIAEEYKPFAKDLHLMNELSQILRKKMISRGYLEFDKPEAKIIVDEKGVPTEIKLREQRTGEKLIENFMIVANETVSEYITNMGLPCIYRVHDLPNPEKLKNLFNILSLKGIKFKSDPNKIKPYDYQKVLESLKKEDFAGVFTTLAIRSMAKARYSDVNIGHFGLASKTYSHFTSPIRRYPDLTLHRLIKDYTINYSDEVVNKWDSTLYDISNQTSQKEQDAINCERDVDKMKKAEYMEQHIGEIYPAVISGVTEFGLFVELPNTVEGLIKTEDLPNDYYIYDVNTLSLIGRRPKNKFTLGDKLTVKVLKASKETSMVDFIIYKEEKEVEKCEQRKKEKNKKEN